MNVRKSLSEKSRWINGVICLVSMFPSWFMVLKLSKKLIFCNFVLTTATTLHQLKQFTYTHLKVALTLFHKMVYRGLSHRLWDISDKNIKKMLIQQKFNKILRLQTVISLKQSCHNKQYHFLIARYETFQIHKTKLLS